MPKKKKKEELICGVTSKRLDELFDIAYELSEDSKNGVELYDKIIKYPVKSSAERDNLMMLYEHITNEWGEVSTSIELKESIKEVSCEEFEKHDEGYMYTVSVDGHSVGHFVTEDAALDFAVICRKNMGEKADIQIYTLEAICEECREKMEREKKGTPIRVWIEDRVKDKIVSFLIDKGRKDFKFEGQVMIISSWDTVDFIKSNFAETHYMILN